MSSRLVLGTAQLGMAYGIANRAGQPDEAHAREIIRLAWENGIEEFDTAQGYGESEEILGRSLRQLNILRKARVITKLHPQRDHLNPALLENAVAESQKKIGATQLYGIMLHREELLALWHKGLAAILAKLVASGQVQRIGVSVYSPEKAIEALNTEGIDMVQVPANVLDRRFEKAGVFDLAKRNQQKVYIRSVFLQGLLLIDKNELPETMQFAVPMIEQLELLCGNTNLSRQELCLAYIKQKYPDAYVIIGVDKNKQLVDNISFWNSGKECALTEMVDKIFTTVDEKIINPILWPN